MINFITACERQDMKQIKKIYFSCSEKIFTTNQNGDTPAHIAVKNNDYDLLVFLLENDIFLNTENNDKKSVFELAVVNEDKRIVELLFSHFGHETFFSSLPNVFLGDYVSNSNDEFLAFFNSLIKNENLEIRDLFNEYEDYSSIKMLKNDEIFALELSLSSISDTEELLALLEYTIINNKKDLSKKVFIELYKKDRAFFIKNSTVSLELAITIEDMILVDFMINAIEEKNINFKDIFRALCISCTIPFFDSFIKKYQKSIKENINMREMLQFSSERNSPELLNKILEFFGAKLDVSVLNESLSKAQSAVFVNYLRPYISNSEKIIYSNIVDLIYKNTNEEFIKDCLTIMDDITYVRSENTTLLHYAIDAENYEVAKFILDNELIDPNIVNVEGQTALSISINKNVYMFELLINDKNVDFENFDNETNSMFNLIYTNNVEDKNEKFLMLLEKTTSSHNLINIDGKCVIHYMLDNDDDFLLTQLLDKEIKKDIVYNQKMSYLDYALFVNAKKCMNILKEHGFLFFKELPATIFTEGLLEEKVLGLDYIYSSYILANYVKDSVYYNNLALINKIKDLKMLRLLFNYGFDINGVSQDIFSPLMIAIEKNDAELAFFIISRGCLINTHVNNENALSLAIKNKNISLIKALCDERIDIPFKDLKITDVALAEIIKERIPLRRIKKHGLVKDSVIDKKTLFGKKTYKYKYIVEPNDSSYIIDIKNTLNIYETCESVRDFIDNMLNSGYQMKVILENQAFDDILIYGANNILKLEDLGMTISQFKDKLHYNFERDFIFLVKHLSLEDCNNINTILFYKILKGEIDIKTRHAINNKEIGYIFNDKKYFNSVALIKKIIKENINE